MKPLALYASAMTVLCATSGALLPSAPQALHSALFDLCVAFSLVAFAGAWLPPERPDAVPANGGER